MGVYMTAQQLYSSTSANHILHFISCREAGRVMRSGEYIILFCVTALMVCTGHNIILPASHTSIFILKA